MIRIEASVVQELVEQASRLQFAAVVPADCGRIDVAAELHTTRERLAKRIDADLQPWFVLLDESIQFLVQFERYLYEFPLSSNLASFAVTTSKLKRDVISIRDLLAIGQDIVSADGKLTHPADRKLTHLGRGWRPLGGRLDVDPGGSSGSEGVGPSGQRGA